MANPRKKLNITILTVSDTRNNKTDKSVFIPLDMKKVSKAQENLRLKRKVPNKNKNTLENCMQLKYL